jgi:HSP20 family protein
MMRHMQHEMDRIFSQAFGGMGGGLSEMEGTGSTGMGMWSPPIEVSEREGKLNICAELPGLKPEEVRVEITPDGLIIEGERRSEDESTQGGIRRSERRYGRFFRSIPLPEGVDPEQVRAQFTNGLLDVQVPLPQQQSQRRQIPIQTGSSSTVDTTGQETKAQEAKR